MKLIQRLFVLLALSVTVAPAFAEGDASGCKDHPLFNRVSNFRISRCEELEFDLKRFPVGPMVDSNKTPSTKVVEVEGRYTRIWYEPSDGKAPGALKVLRNFENATKAGKGTIEGQYPGWCPGKLDETFNGKGANACMSNNLTMKFAQGGKEIWALLSVDDPKGKEYQLYIVEREAMKQDVTANDWLDQINKDGWVEIAINFDTGKATIKPDSAATVEQMVQLLKSNPALKVEVGGHTDNIGDAAANLKLSDARAQSVMQALIKGGIAAIRLTAKGYGQTMPVADNRREEGRAKNRRVELVKK